MKKSMLKRGMKLIFLFCNQRSALALCFEICFCIVLVPVDEILDAGIDLDTTKHLNAAAT